MKISRRTNYLKAFRTERPAICAALGFYGIHDAPHSSMRLLIAINSCEVYEQAGANDAARNTWLPDAKASGFDYKFFHGHWAKTGGDIQYVDAPDDYQSLCYKTLESLRWAVSRGYDFCYRCYPDTYCRPERLRVSGFERFDYSGNFEGGSVTAAGGPGYWLSRKACEVMLTHHVSPGHPNIGATFEDRWVGTVMNMYRDSLTRFDERRLVEGGWLRPESTPTKQNDAISAHMWGGEGGKPEVIIPWVYEAHKRWMES